MSEEQNKKNWNWIGAALQWLAPLVLSALVGYGSVQYAQGASAQKLATVERDVEGLTRKVEQSPSREELKLMLEDLKEIKQDVREIRRSLTK